MLGNSEESAAIAPADRQFLHECLKVRREREGYLHTPPRSPAWSVPTPPASLRGEDMLPRPRFGGPPVRLELHHLGDSSRLRARHLPSGLHSETGGEDAFVLAVSELMRATAAVQAREREVVERVNKLELKMPSSSKVASEFQRMWAGMTAMAEKINEELDTVKARLDELERGGGERRSATDSSLAELSPFSAKSVGSEPTLRRTPGKSLILPQEIPSLDAPSQLTHPDSSAHTASERRGGEATECVEEKNVGQNLALSELLESLNRLKGAAEEEASRLGRVECEMHQQVLENRHRLDNLSAEFGSLRQIIPGLHAWKQGLEDELSSLRKEVEGELLAAKQGLNHELERSTAQLQRELELLTQDLGQEVRASTKELDLKLERLTVVVGTAAFFQRGSQGDTLSHSVSSVVNGHSLQSSQTKALANESVHAGTAHNEDAAPGNTDLHTSLKRLGLAVEALQRNFVKTNKGVVQVKEECSSECKALRSDLRRLENAMNGYLQSWSVESAGLTEQVLSLWKVVRTGRYRQNGDAVRASIRVAGQDDPASTQTRKSASSTENTCGASEHGSEDGGQEGQGES